MMRAFVLGFIRIHILPHAAKEPFYGGWMIEELENRGYQISPGTLYPTLSSLEEFGYPKNHEEVVKDKRRKHYHGKEKGEKKLEEIRPKIRELVNKMLEGN